MELTVHLHTLLQIKTEKGLIRQLDCSVEEGMTLDHLLNQLNIHPDLENTLLVINGQICELGERLNDGDQIHLIPAISGG